MPKGGPRPNSGRKSAYQELRDALDTQGMFFNDIDLELLEQKVRTGKFSIKDRYILTALEGDTKILQSISNKVLPDKINIKGDLTISQVLDQLDTSDEADQLRYNNAYGQEIEGQVVETEPPLQDSEQEGETDPVQIEPGTDPLPPKQVV